LPNNGNSNSSASLLIEAAAAATTTATTTRASIKGARNNITVTTATAAAAVTATATAATPNHLINKRRKQSPQKRCLRAAAVAVCVALLVGWLPVWLDCIGLVGCCWFVGLGCLLERVGWDSCWNNDCLARV